MTVTCLACATGGGCFEASVVEDASVVVIRASVGTGGANLNGDDDGNDLRWSGVNTYEVRGFAGDDTISADGGAGTGSTRKGASCAAATPRRPRTRGSSSGPRSPSSATRAGRR